jgi:2-oxoglutarate ferredoxin oxidoreductase subunit delta
MTEDTASKKRPRIVVNKAWCKGCGICVEFCPQDVLEMKDGSSEVAHIEKCTLCQLCELRCPDFAIEVSEEE